MEQRRETVASMPTNLGAEFQRTFAEVLAPRVVSLLQEQLQPITTTLAEHHRATSQQYEVIVSKLESNKAELKALPRTQFETSALFQLTSQQQYDGILSTYQDAALSRTAAINTIKRHVNSTIKGLGEGSSRQLVEGYPSRRPRPRRQKVNRADQPLEALYVASGNGRIDCGPLEDL